MDKNDLPDFSGKLILFYTSSAPNGIKDGVLMEYTSFVKYGNRLFIKGRTPVIEEKGIDWVSNLKGGIAWEDVTHYLIFNSREDYINRIGVAHENVPLWKRLFR